MLMNYHEMTMNEPRDSAQRKRQFLIICSVMAAVLVYTLMTAGILEPLEPESGVFPGGNFAYKFTNRDYAATMGLGRIVTKDLIGAQHADKATRQMAESILYHVYLDDPPRMGGRRQRWMTGILVGDQQQDKIQKLMDINTAGRKAKRQPTEEEMAGLPAREIFDLLPYELADLPSVDSLVLKFPHNHGFVSALVLSYRVIPALRRMAVEKGEKGNIPVVIANCNKGEQTCTLYAPLVQGKEFLLGRPDTEAHLSILGEEHYLDLEGFKQGVMKIIPFTRPYLS